MSAWPTFLGFVVLNSFAFAIDLVLLTLLHGGLGVEYHISRIVAGACEAVYIYSAIRWVVFRR